MVAPIFIPWDNPWGAPVLWSDPPPRAFNFSGFANVSAGIGSVPSNWWVGVRPIQINVSITCAGARTIQVLVYQLPYTLIGGDTFVLASGTHSLAVPIVGQTTDLSNVTVDFGSAVVSGDSLNSVSLDLAPPVYDEFWTSFTKSYEIP